MNRLPRWTRGIAALLIAALSMTGATPALASGRTQTVRVGDLVSVEGARSYPLIGYGLVVGLDGTGDRMRNAPFTQSSVQALLARMGVKVDAATLRTQNVAAVMVTATLPPFAAPGSRIDVQVSAMGDATRIAGGTLLATNLATPTSAPLAVAQGVIPEDVDGRDRAARGGPRTSPTAVLIPGGATVESVVPFAMDGGDGALRLAVKRQGAGVAQAIAAAVNRAGIARATSGQGDVLCRFDGGAPSADALAALLAIELEVDAPKRILFDRAAGSIILSAPVRVTSGGIGVGGVVIQLGGDGEGRVPVPGGADLGAILAMLSQLGMSAADQFAILAGLHTTGAIDAELIVT